MLDEHEKARGLNSKIMTTLLAFLLMNHLALLSSSHASWRCLMALPLPPRSFGNCRFSAYLSYACSVLLTTQLLAAIAQQGSIPKLLDGQLDDSCFLPSSNGSGSSPFSLTQPQARPNVPHCVSRSNQGEERNPKLFHSSTIPIPQERPSFPSPHLLPICPSTPPQSEDLHHRRQGQSLRAC
jgi:hypothetical protein